MSNKFHFGEPVRLVRALDEYPAIPIGSPGVVRQTHLPGSTSLMVKFTVPKPKGEDSEVEEVFAYVNPADIESSENAPPSPLPSPASLK
jgi:hypothetical protein